jgi:hypothetical protein
VLVTDTKDTCACNIPESSSIGYFAQGGTKGGCPGRGRRRRQRLHAAPLALALAGAAGVLPQLVEAYRGGGVPYADYGRVLRDGIAAANRPMFLPELATTWLPAVPDVDQRLRSAPPPRVLDLGCGLGASSVALARAYPRVTVLGVDLDEASVAQARTAAAEAGWPTASPSWSATPPGWLGRPRST